MRRILVLGVVVMLAITGWLAWSTISTAAEERVAAAARLVSARIAIGDAVTELARETAAKLAAGEAVADAVREYEVSGSELPGPVTESPVVDAFLGVTPSKPSLLRVGVRTGPDRFRVAEMPLSLLKSVLDEDARVGPPGRAGAPFTRIALVTAPNVVLWTRGRAIADGEDLDPLEWTRHFAMAVGGEPFELLPSGLPPTHKGRGGGATYGVWGPVDALPGLFAAAEVSDEHIVAPLGGLRLGISGHYLDQRAHLWHVTLGLAALLLVWVGFASIKPKEGNVGPLIRTYSFARPYIGPIAIAIALGFAVATRKVFEMYLAKQVTDGFLVDARPGATSQLYSLGISVAVMGVFLGVCGFFKTYMQGWISVRMILDIRLALGRKLLSLPLPYFDKMRSGDVLSRIDRDVAGLRQVLDQVFKNFFVEPFNVAAAVMAAFLLNKELAVVILGMPIVVYPLFRIAKRIKKKSKKRQLLAADISHVMFQMLSGIKVVKAFAGEKREETRLTRVIEKFFKEAKKIQRLMAISESMLDVLQYIGAAVVLVAGGMYVLKGSVSFGDLAAFMVFIQSMYTASKKLTSTANKLVAAVPAAERVFEVLDAKDELPEGTRELAFGRLSQGIRFEGVTFKYQEQPILHSLDLEIPAGQVVALVGPTGAGKTTVCDLVARFYDVESGSVTIDGVDVREFTRESMYRNLAIVTQEPFLFNSTIEENIRYGRDEATRKEIEAAADGAFVLDEIQHMEGGFQKLAGERGASLSGGQRQRVTIARALLKDSGVLILDEATSNLDSHAEAKVQAALGKLMEGRTVIVVAHRLSTIRNADKVVVLEAGRILEQGSPAELLARPGSRFKDMVELQSRMDSEGDGGA